MSTIVNVRGTSGSGKSTVVYDIMKRYPTVPIRDADEKLIGYRVKISPKQNLYVVGRYETPCGGCDGVGSFAEVIKLVDHFARLGHVIFEGLLISDTWGAIGEWSLRYGADFVFAYLNTPLETCILRVKKRRQKKGNTKPLNETNTRVRFDRVLRTKERALENKRRVVDLPYKSATDDVLKLFLGVRRAN